MIVVHGTAELRHRVLGPTTMNLEAGVLALLLVVLATSGSLPDPVPDRAVVARLYRGSRTTRRTPDQPHVSSTSVEEGAATHRS